MSIIRRTIKEVVIVEIKEGNLGDITTSIRDHIQAAKVSHIYYHKSAGQSMGQMVDLPKRIQNGL